jgi:ankyrin repeat protein
MLQYGDTALDWAAFKGNLEVMEMLVEYGAVDIRNEVL